MSGPREEPTVWMWTERARLAGGAVTHNNLAWRTPSSMVALLTRKWRQGITVTALRGLVPIDDFAYQWVPYEVSTPTLTITPRDDTHDDQP